MMCRLQRSIERRTNKAGESDNSHMKLAFTFVSSVNVMRPDFRHFDSLVSIDSSANTQMVILNWASASENDKTIA